VQSSTAVQVAFAIRLGMATGRAAARLARIEQLIAKSRSARRRELLRRVMRLQRQAEASARRLARPQSPRIH